MLTNPLTQLSELLRACDFLHLTIAEADTDAPEYCLSLRREGRRQTFVSATLEQLLAAASGTERRKRCSRCGVEKAPAEFPKVAVRKDRPDGRHSHCKLCDRERKRKYSRRAWRKRGLTAAQAEGAQAAEPAATQGG